MEAISGRGESVWERNSIWKEFWDFSLCRTLTCTQMTYPTGKRELPKEEKALFNDAFSKLHVLSKKTHEATL